MLSNHCNVTGLLRRLQVNIQVFKIIKQNGDVLKNWLCPNFLSLPKESELPKIWGGCSPPRPHPPARTPMMKTANWVEGEGFANFVHVVVYFKLFFSEIRSIMENPSYNEKDNIIYTEGIY